MSLNASDTPKLLDQDPPTSTSPSHTLYSEIDLKVDAIGVKHVGSMTAIFASDPKQFKAGDVDVILYEYIEKYFPQLLETSKNLISLDMIM